MLGLLSGTLSALAPGLRFAGSDADASDVLKARGSAAGGAPARERLRSVLVVGQVAVSLLLVACAALFLWSVRTAERAHPGFATENLLLMTVNPGDQGYDRLHSMEFYRQLVASVEAVPGARSAALVRDIPLGNTNNMIRVFPDRWTSQRGDGSAVVLQNVVTPGYFRTMSILLLEGRDFEDRDTESSAGVAIINEAFAQKFWPGQEPMGRRIRLEQLGSWAQVVGVARNTVLLLPVEAPRPCIYLPLTQHFVSDMTLVLQASGDLIHSARMVREEVRKLDSGLPVYNIKTMDVHLRNTPILSLAHLAARLSAIFGALALALAIAGLYGLVSHTVSQRTHEIGIRIALGARTGQVLRMVIAQGLKLVLAGVAFGLCGAFAFSRLLSSLLFNLRGSESALILGVSVVLVLATVFAAYIPARRATKVSPAGALRFE